MFIFISTIPYFFCMLYRNKEGCQACGKKTQQKRPFVSSCNLNIEDIQSYFGPEAISGDSCHNCVCLINRWRRQRSTREVTIVKKISIYSKWIIRKNKILLPKTSYLPKKGYTYFMFIRIRLEIYSDINSSDNNLVQKLRIFKVMLLEKDRSG